MSALHYHPVYAWNLLEDLRASRCVSDEFFQGYASGEIHKLRQSGLINEASMATARQMFVFADSVVLPVGVDISVGNTTLFNRQCLHWGHDILEDSYLLTDVRSDPSIDSSLTGTLAKLILDPSIDEMAVHQIVDWWNRLHSFEAAASRRVRPKGEGWQALTNSGLRRAIVQGEQERHPFWHTLSPQAQQTLLGILANDPLREETRFAHAAMEVERTLYFARRANLFAAKGCPTLSRVRSSPAMTVPDDPKDLAAVVRLYFDGIRLPAPENAKEALRFRENSRILDWRAKLLDWQGGISSGKLDLKSIQQELDDASGYIEGAEGIRTAVRKLPAFITTPLAVACEFLPDLPGKRELQIGLIAIDVVRLLPPLIVGSVKGPAPLQYGWALVEPPTEAGTDD